MKNELIEIGKKSKKAFLSQPNSKKKNKVLKDYCDLIKKNKKIIIQQNNKDVQSQINKNTFLKKKLAESQNLINNNCGQWYRP